MKQATDVEKLDGGLSESTEVLDVAEWSEGVPRLIDGAVFDVRLKDGQQRQCRRIPTLDWSSLFFTDCTHPAQNAYCADSLITSWRVSPNRPGNR